MRLPEFHGDPLNYPEESWKTYEANISLAYEGSGLTDKTDITEGMKRAHLIAGLKGKAARFIELNPEIRTLPYQEALLKLRRYFKRFESHSYEDLGRLKQKPGESVMEFVARLKAAVNALGPGEEFIETTKKKAREEGVEPVPEDVVKQRTEMFNDFNEGLVKHLFMKGIKDDYKIALRARQPRTLKEAVRIAEEQEQYDEMYGEVGSLNMTLVSSDYRNKASVVQQAAQQLQKLNQNSETQQGQSLCFYCGREGHFVRTCHLRQLDLQRPQQRWTNSTNRQPGSHRQQPGLQRQQNDTSTRRTPRMPTGDRIPRHGSTSPRPTMSSSSGRSSPAPGTGRPQLFGEYQNSNSRNSFASSRQDKGWVDNHVKFADQKNGQRPPQRGGLALPRPILRQ